MSTTPTLKLKHKDGATSIVQGHVAGKFRRLIRKRLILGVKIIEEKGFRK